MRGCVILGDDEMEPAIWVDGQKCLLPTCASFLVVCTNVVCLVVSLDIAGVCDERDVSSDTWGAFAGSSESCCNAVQAGFPKCALVRTRCAGHSISASSLIHASCGTVSLCGMCVLQVTINGALWAAMHTQVCAYFDTYEDRTRYIVCFVWIHCVVSCLVCILCYVCCQEMVVGNVAVCREL